MTDNTTREAELQKNGFRSVARDELTEQFRAQVADLERKANAAGARLVILEHTQSGRLLIDWGEGMALEVELTDETRRHIFIAKECRQ